MLPLAAALAAAGHRVRIASGHDVLRADAGGLPVEDVGGPGLPAAALRVALGHPRLMAREATGRAGVRMAGELFGTINAGMLDGLLRLARSWQPELVVFESLGGSGAVAAAAIG